MDTLHLRIVNGSDLRNPNWTGKADPYCVVKHGDATYKTSVKSGAGKNCHWNETFQMRADRFNPIYIECWDKDTLSSDDLIGKTQIDMSSIYDATTPTDTTIQLKKGSTVAGNIRLVIEVKKVGMVGENAGASTSAPQVAPQVMAPPQQPGIVYGGAAPPPVQSDAQLFSTTVPMGHGPGMQIPVNVNGQQFMVPIPPGFGPGMTFQFRVPTGEIGKTLFTQAVGAAPAQYGQPPPQYAQPGQIQQMGQPVPQYAQPPAQYGAPGQVQQYGQPPAQYGYGQPPQQAYGQPGYPTRQY